MSDEQDEAGFLDGFTLAPDWAKKSSDSYSAGNMKKYAFDDERGSRDAGPRRGGGRDFGARRDEGRRDFGDRREGGLGDRFRRPSAGGAPRGDDPRRRFGDAPAPRMPRPPMAAGSPDVAATRSEPASDRPPRRDFRDRDFRGREAAPREPLPFEIRFLPDQKALSVIAHKVQAGHRAIPLRSLVKLFFDNPDSTEVRLEFTAEHRERRFHQCTACGWFAMSEEALKGHLMSVHFPEWFTPEDIAVEPPSGNFTSVARCGFTGKLLAPPNHHSYNKRIQAMLRGECAGRSEEEYRARIELVNTPEAIEQWRQEAAKQTVYVRKPEPAPAKPRHAKKRPEATPAAEGASAPEAPAEAVPAPEAPVEAPPAEAAPEPVRLSLEAAEEQFLREIAPALMRADKQVTATHVATKAMNDRFLLDAIASAWSREQLVQTASLFFAVRGGLRSRKLALFRASDSHREEFVMHKDPVALDAQHAVPELRMILDYIALHPGCTRVQMLAEIVHDGVSKDMAEAIHKQLAFVTERGYVIEYFNGMLALPEEHPYFANLPKQNPSAAKAADGSGDRVQGSGDRRQERGVRRQESGDAAPGPGEEAKAEATAAAEPEPPVEAEAPAAIEPAAAEPEPPVEAEAPAAIEPAAADPEPAVEAEVPAEPVSEVKEAEPEAVEPVAPQG